MAAEREPSPKAELPMQARSHTSQPQRPRSKVAPEEPQRTHAQHAPSHTVSTLQAGEQPASRSGSPSSTTLEASLIECCADAYAKSK